MWYKRPVRRALPWLAIVSIASIPVAAWADPPDATPEPDEPAASPAPAPAPAPTLDVATLVARAEKNWPGVRAASHRIAAAEAQLDEAIVSPFWQLSATATFTVAPQVRGSPIFSPDPQLPLDNPWSPIVRVGVEGAIPLWTFGKIGAARDAARAGVRVAEIDRERGLAQLRTDVRRAYFALQLALDAEQMLSEGRPALERAVARLEERIEAGDADANEMDRWRLSSTLAEVAARSSEATRLERASRAALVTLTGLRQVDVPDCAMEPVVFEPRPVAWYVRTARAHRAESRMLDQGIAAREANVTATRARYFPDLALALSASYSYGPGITDQENPFIVDGANYAALGWALVARWSLDVWGNAHRTHRAEEELLGLRDQAEEARFGIALEIATLYEELLDAKRRVEAWQRGHRDGRAWFLAAAQAYQVGAAEPRDLVDAVRAYFTNRFNHMQAIRDYNDALSRLERAVGVPVVPAAGWERACDARDG